MSRNTWNIYIQESGGSWTADGTIYVPNDVLEDETLSTHRKVVLADGSTSFVNLETKITKSDITFSWYNLDNTDSLISKLETYLADNSTIKIVNHLNEAYIGKIRNLRKTHPIGIEGVIDLEMTLERN